MTDLLSQLTFTSGHSMKNRFMLAPLTNCQSHVDGTLSDDEYTWLTKRAEGGFGLTMTCAAHVQAIGQGFPGQLGIWDDKHIAGLTRLAGGIKAHNSVALVQLHHAGMRSSLVKELLDGAPVCPSDNERSGARGLTLAETQQLIEDFVRAAERAQAAGFDGVELHGAHGYILCQYFSAAINARDDAFGGDTQGRYRILFEIIDGVRTRCGADFVLGVRLSPERFGMQLGEVLGVAERLLTDDRVDFLDMSLWDCFKQPEDEAFKGKSLMEHFAALKRGNTRLGAAGALETPADAEKLMAAGYDYAMLGRAAMWNHDFPKLYADNRTFTPAALPVSRAYLNAEGISDTFVDYIKGNWPQYVAE
ncbi:NADH:flavin oxidoreductase [Pyruvatibacter sp.]|uniref:NADH:flavin oxidoreductase n=1 Tax=Pyruvatibacter sp. TaxID=1981328 RepID=UPI0032EC2C76